MRKQILSLQHTCRALCLLACQPSPSIPGCWRSHDKHLIQLLQDHQQLVASFMHKWTVIKALQL